MRILSKGDSAHPHEQRVLRLAPMRVMHATTASLISRLHASAVDTHACQCHGSLGWDSLTWQRLLKVPLRLNVSFFDHLRANSCRRLIEAARTDFDIAKLLQQSYADRVGRSMRYCDQFLCEHSRTGWTAVNPQRDPLRGKNPARKPCIERLAQREAARHLVW